MRHPSRWDLTPAAQRLLTTLLMCMRGSICIYQGEELGLREAEVDYEHLQDPYGREFWPNYKGRDGCRTPMVWEHAFPNGGFTTGRPWLPVGEEHLALAADLQDNDPMAMLQHYRRAIGFRQAHAALLRGAQDKVVASGDVLFFTRSLDEEAIFCAFNLSDSSTDLSLPEGNWIPVGAELGCVGFTAGGKVRLGPWQSCLALKH